MGADASERGARYKCIDSLSSGPFSGGGECDLRLGRGKQSPKTVGDCDPAIPGSPDVLALDAGALGRAERMKQHETCTPTAHDSPKRLAVPIARARLDGHDQLLLVGSCSSP